MEISKGPEAISVNLANQGGIPGQTEQINNEKNIAEKIKYLIFREK